MTHDDSATATARAADARMLDDIRAVWPEGRAAAWSVDLLHQLMRTWPASYAGLDAQRFGLLLRAAGVPTRNVRRAPSSSSSSVVRRGILLADLTAAIAGAAGEDGLAELAAGDSAITTGALVDFVRAVAAMTAGGAR